MGLRSLFKWEGWCAAAMGKGDGIIVVFCKLVEKEIQKMRLKGQTESRSSSIGIWAASIFSARED